MKFTYTFRLSSASSYIDLFQKLTNIKSCKITSFRFTTVSTGSLYAIVSINGFNDKVLLDSGAVRKYCKLILMPDVANGIISYENQSQYPDIICNRPQDLSGFVCDVQFSLSNGSIVYSSDVTTSNPAVIEIEFEGGDDLV
jgi:hypothetical protein